MRANKQIGTINPDIYGHFVELVYHCFYGGIMSWKTRAHRIGIGQRGLYFEKGRSYEVRINVKQEGVETLVATLRAMKEDSYVYAIIGRVAPTEFYTQAVGAIVIENSDPGMATRLLRE